MLVDPNPCGFKGRYFDPYGFKDGLNQLSWIQRQEKFVPYGFEAQFSFFTHSMFRALWIQDLKFYFPQLLLQH